MRKIVDSYNELLRKQIDLTREANSKLEESHKQIDELKSIIMKPKARLTITNLLSNDDIKRIFTLNWIPINISKINRKTYLELDYDENIIYGTYESEQHKLYRYDKYNELFVPFEYQYPGNISIEQIQNIISSKYPKHGFQVSNVKTSYKFDDILICKATTNYRSFYVFYNMRTASYNILRPDLHIGISKRIKNHIVSAYNYQDTINIIYYDIDTNEIITRVVSNIHKSDCYVLCSDDEILITFGYSGAYHNNSIIYGMYINLKDILSNNWKYINENHDIRYDELDYKNGYWYCKHSTICVKIGKSLEELFKCNIKLKENVHYHNLRVSSNIVMFVSNGSKELYYCNINECNTNKWKRLYIDDNTRFSLKNNVILQQTVVNDMLVDAKYCDV